MTIPDLSIESFLYQSQGFEGLENVIDDLKVNSDTECVVNACGFLDEGLKSILHVSFPLIKSLKLCDEDHGLLYTFSAKINMARALSLISDADRKLMNAIRRVRNEFAHPVGPYVTFTNPSSRLRKKLLKLSVPLDTVDRLGIVTSIPIDDWPPKFRFIAAAAIQARILRDIHP